MNFRQKQCNVLLREATDVWILGSGPSMQYVDPDFFVGRMTIGANDAYKYFPTTYTVCKHVRPIPDALVAGQIVIAPKYDCANNTLEENKFDHDNFFTFRHKRRGKDIVDEAFKENIDAIGQDEDVFVSRSVITSAIHIAAICGAKNIILCGHDCGYIENVSHIPGYLDIAPVNYNMGSDSPRDCPNKWFDSINAETIELKKKLKAVYGCHIYSLNPFINFRLEGKEFTRKWRS